MRDAHDRLTQEATDGGRMLALHVTPYITGLPYRIGAFEDLLGWLAAQQGPWFAPAQDIVAAARPC